MPKTNTNTNTNTNNDIVLIVDGWFRFGGGVIPSELKNFWKSRVGIKHHIVGEIPLRHLHLIPRFDFDNFEEEI